MASRKESTGATVKISTGTHARVVLACESLRIIVSEFMERAALASLQRQQEAKCIKSYELACARAEATGQNSPSPEEFNLPRDYGIPPHP